MRGSASAADGFFVAVGGGGVQQAIADVQCLGDGALGVLSGDLVDTDYLGQRRELTSSTGELTDLFREPTLQEQFDQVGRQLLLALGRQLTHSPAAPPPPRAMNGTEVRHDVGATHAHVNGFDEDDVVQRAGL